MPDAGCKGGDVSAGAAEQGKASTILSIDGGGIRGIIPATVLKEIERRAKAPICRLFDAIAGTSTGGILALGLSCPGADGGPRFSAAELLAMYGTQGRRIFPHEFLAAVRQLFVPKYPERGRREVLAERFRQARLSEALTEVLITSYDVEGRRPVFFRRSDAQSEPGRDHPMLEVALATSAAPTYFPPVRLPGGRDGRDMVLVDGGVFANNPSMCGLVDRTTGSPSDPDTLMVSLGTGELTKALGYRSARHWGLIGWGPHILDVVFDGVTETTEFEAEQILGGGYRRFQPRLSADEEAMDNTSKANVHALEATAETLVQERSDELDKLCEELRRRAGLGGDGGGAG